METKQSERGKSNWLRREIRTAQARKHPLPLSLLVFSLGGALFRMGIGRKDIIMTFGGAGLLVFSGLWYLFRRRDKSQS